MQEAAVRHFQHDVGAELKRCFRKPVVAINDELVPAGTYGIVLNVFHNPGVGSTLDIAWCVLEFEAEEQTEFYNKGRLEKTTCIDPVTARRCLRVLAD